MEFLEDIKIEHKKEFERLRLEEGVFNGDYCFGNLFAWGKVFGTKVCFCDGMYSSVASISKDRLLISFPLGNGDKKKLIGELRGYAKSLGKTAVMGFMPERLKEKAEALMGEELVFSRIRNSDDYVYLVENMISLPGDALHSKKNMLNSFLKNDYEYEVLTEKNLLCAKEFCMGKAFSEDEKLVIERLFDEFKALELSGAILKINGRIVAATVAERSGDTVIIHIEKAEKDVRGAYAAINNLYLKNSHADALYVNREDDMGLENLRRAKLSYKPEFMVKKYIAEFRV